MALETGDLEAGLIWAGQVQGLIHDVPTCRALIERIVADAEAIINDRLRRIATAKPSAHDADPTLPGAGEPPSARRAIRTAPAC